MMVVGRKSIENVEIVNGLVFDIASACMGIREMTEPTLSRYLVITSVMERIKVLIPQLIDLEQFIREDDAKRRSSSPAYDLWQMEWEERGSNSVVGYLNGIQLLLKSLHDCLDAYRLQLEQQPNYALLVSRLLGFCVNTGLLVSDPEQTTETVKYRSSLRPANWNLTSEAIH